MYRKELLWHYFEESALVWEVTMIKKVEGGYKVLSEKGNKNLGGHTKLKRKLRKDCSRWNTSNTKKAETSDVASGGVETPQ
jgi:hypothetical protein